MNFIFRTGAIKNPEKVGKMASLLRSAPGMCTFFEPFIIMYCYISGGCMEKFPGAQFYGKCTLRVHKIKA